jgi:hypothetical protein
MQTMNEVLMRYRAAKGPLFITARHIHAVHILILESRFSV